MIDTILNNRYKLIKVIGTGGMSTVYKGWDITLNRNVAIKILKSELVSSPDFVASFEREARAVARLQHSNIVNVYDVGRDEDRYYIIMELIDSWTLEDFIKSQNLYLTNRTIIYIATQIAEALQNAHDHNIIHRDVKPQNILINDDLNLKVTDFGIARIVDQATVVSIDEAMGTVHYCSPEQLRGGYVDVKTDIYSYGILLYELATGKLPYQANSTISIALKHLNEKFVSPTAINMSLNPTIEKIINICTMRSPDDRFKSMQDIIVILDRLSLAPDVDIEFGLSLVDGDKSNADSSLGDGLDLDVADESILKAKAFYSERSVSKEMPEYQTRKFTKSSITIDDNKEIPSNLESEDDLKTVSVEEDYDDLEFDYYEDEKNPLFSFFKMLIVAFLGIALGFFALYMIYIKPIKEAEKNQPFVLISVEGLSFSDASQKLVEKGLYLKKISTSSSDSVPANAIISQSPEAGTTVKAGQTVNVVVSDGEKLRQLPNLKQKTIKQAEIALNNLGLKNIQIKEEHNILPKGLIISQSPEPKKEVLSSEEISLIVSLGPELQEVIMPTITNRTRADAISALVDLGLKYNVTTEFNDEVEKGYVISQSIKDGKKVEEGVLVSFAVSLGKENKETENEITVPATEENKPPISDDTPNETTQEPKPTGVDADGLVAKTYYIPLGTNKESYNVKVTGSVGGVESILYEKVHPKEDTNVKVTIRAKGSVRLKFYLDGEKQEEIVEIFTEE